MMGELKSREDEQEKPLSSDEELLEKLSELEHKQWVEWTRALADTGIAKKYQQKRWLKLWIPYSQLSEEMKELDRQYARRVLPILKEVRKQDEKESEEKLKESMQRQISNFNDGKLAEEKPFTKVMRRDEINLSCYSAIAPEAQNLIQDSSQDASDVDIIALTISNNSPFRLLKAQKVDFEVFKELMKIERLEKQLKESEGRILEEIEKIGRVCDSEDEDNLVEKTIEIKFRDWQKLKEKYSGSHEI